MAQHSKQPAPKKRTSRHKEESSSSETKEMSLGEALSQIKEHIKKIKLKPRQLSYRDKIYHNEVIFCHGPAGTSKTFTACLAALELLSNGIINKVMLIKPVQEAGEKLGFLPGDVREKLEPYICSFRDTLIKLIPEQVLLTLEREGVIVYNALAYMRGATYDNTFMVLDEAQNANYKQLMLFITRMGHDTKVLMSGDVSQHDIEKKNVALPSMEHMLKEIKGVTTHVFTEEDIVRKKILIEIVKRYETWKALNGI